MVEVGKVLAIQNARGEHLGYLADVLDAQDVEYEYTKPTSLPPLENFSHLVVLGGPMGVYESDRYPFLGDEIAYLRRAFSSGIPVLGICLGAQLMAKSLGGDVFPGGKKELGWHHVVLTELGREDAVMGFLPSKFTAFHWHGDTFTLPDNTLHLASSQMYENQSFRYDASYALQFHLEVTEEMIRDWTAELDSKMREEILNQVDENIDPLNSMAENFLKNWLKL